MLKVGARITEDGVNMAVEVVAQLVTVETPLDMGAVRYLAHQVEEVEQAMLLHLMQVALEVRGGFTAVMEA